MAHKDQDHVTDLDDVEKADYSGDGESTIDPFETTGHLHEADGKSTFDGPDVRGADRVLESIEDGLNVIQTEGVTGGGTRENDSDGDKPKAAPKKAPAKAAAPKADAPKADADGDK